MIAFIDETGDTGRVIPAGGDTGRGAGSRWFSAGGILVPDSRCLDDVGVVMRMLEMEFFPNARAGADVPDRWELKGSNVRNVLSRGAPSEQKHRVRYLTMLARLLSGLGVELAAVVGVKPMDRKIRKQEAYVPLLDVLEDSDAFAAGCVLRHDGFRHQAEKVRLQAIVDGWCGDSAEREPMKIDFVSSAVTPAIQAADHLVSGLLVAASAHAVPWPGGAPGRVPARHHAHLAQAINVAAPGDSVKWIDLETKRVHPWTWKG